MEAGEAIPLGSRALDILIALVRHAGETVSKDELMALVWPDTVVEDNTLRVHMTALRRALGAGGAGRRFVANIPGRGYRFIAPVTAAEEPAPSAEIRGLHNLPSQLTKLIGRDDAVAELVNRLPRQRFLTITGAGGIGKTGVALAVANRLIGRYQHGVWLIDLGPLADARLVPGTIASALSLSVRAEDPIAGLVEALAERQIVLVLDCCEHLVAGVAEMAEALSRAVPGAHLLVTSREPLRAEGEWIYRLPPLQVPPIAPIPGVADALGFAAIQLFVERAAASSGSFELKDADVSSVADICRRLDGIPLAIELAAARVDFLGIRGLISLLDDRFRLLMQGRRTALPRHQSLRATLDWSYSLLAETDRVILRQLSTFRGYFTLDAAGAVVAHPTIATSAILNGVIGLAEKSLIVADATTETIRFRLLDTTRAYALEKLTESGEFSEAARRHATYFYALLDQAEPQFAVQPKIEWLGTYGGQIDNVRAAIDWAFSPSGDAALGVSLTVAAVPLWMNLSLIGECRDRVNQALSAPETVRDERRSMQLYAGLGGALLYTVGPGAEVNEAWTKALTIAESLRENDCRFRALWGLWVSRINNSDHRIALDLGRKFLAEATRVHSLIDSIIGDRMVGFSSHFLGDQSGARRHLERMASRYVPELHRSHILRYQYDQWATALGTLGVILWLQGFPEQAMDAVEKGVNEAVAVDHAVSLCSVLAQGACPVAVFTGNIEAGERFVVMLLDSAAKHGLEVWHAIGRCFEDMLQIRHGDAASGLHSLGEKLRQLPEARFALRYPSFLAEFAAAVPAQERAQGLQAIDRAIDRCERHDDRWYFPELLRIKSRLLLLEENVSHAPAERYLIDSLDWARRQGSRSWELRTAISLAELRRDEGHAKEAENILRPVYERFTEGFYTADLQQAQTLLDQLG